MLRSFRFLSTRSEFSQHKALLERLGLSQVNQGVFDGAWSGDGELLHSRNPATGNVIASVHCAKPNDLKQILAKIEDAKPIWTEVC